MYAVLKDMAVPCVTAKELIGRRRGFDFLISALTKRTLASAL
jgi:hypothetical protein